MRTSGWLVLARPPSTSVTELLDSCGGRAEPEDRLTWTLPTAELASRAAEQLVSAGEEVLHGLRYVPEAEDDPEDLFAYLPLEELITFGHGLPTEPFLAFDLANARILGNDAVVEAMALTPSVWLNGLPGSLHVLCPPPLPEPVLVPRALEIFEGGRASFVRSDGVELLTVRNQRFLADHGLGTSVDCLVGDRTVRWVRPTIVRADVLQRLVEAGTRGLLAPQYLGTSGQETARSLSV